MSKTMKLAVVSPNPSDGTAWYRSSLPFIRMQQKYDDFQFQEFGLSGIDWDILMNFDVLFLQRPCGPEQVRLANKALFLGLKVWVDFDDMLWDIHPSSPVYQMYSSGEIQNAIERIMNLKGITITVSTRRLKEEIEKKWPHQEQIFLIENAMDLIDENVSGFEHQFVLWRGSETHVSDLDIFRGYFDTVMLSHPNIRFEFFGYNPWYWTSRIANTTHKPGTSLIDYHASTHYPNWKVWVCMLEDTPFNRCKSNILFLEATKAGAVCVCPNWEEWQRPGALNYDNVVHFKEVMEQAINMSKAEHDEFLKQARMWVNTCNLGQVNTRRHYILKHEILNHEI